MGAKRQPNDKNRPLSFILLPLIAVALLALALTKLNLASPPSDATPPQENLTVEKIEIRDHQLSAKLRADGADPLLIAQVMVDGAFWHFKQSPSGPLARGNSAWFDVVFPWVADETHHLRFVTSTGATFDHTIALARETPTFSLNVVSNYVAVGLLVGLIPILCGMLAFPALRIAGEKTRAFVFALTIGLLVYLLIDMFVEGLEFADRASGFFGGKSLVIVSMLLSFAALRALAAQNSDVRDGMTIATLIAAGIGLHNFGEGLVIGAAFAAHEIVLSTLLIVGFGLHNLTEGVAIVSPLVRRGPSILSCAMLAMLAGIPVVPGILTGTFLQAPHFSALFFGVGAGAIAQVVCEIDRFCHHADGDEASFRRFSRVSVAGYFCGIAVMSMTALLISL